MRLNSKDEFAKKNNLQGNATRELRDINMLKPADRYEANMMEFEEPISYEDASGKDAENWKRAIDEELKSHEVNNIWDLSTSAKRQEDNII